MVRNGDTVEAHQVSLLLKMHLTKANALMLIALVGFCKHELAKNWRGR